MLSLKFRILPTFLLILFIPNISWSFENLLTPDDVLDKFPLCSVLSSYGQLCKSMKSEEASSFTPRQIINVQSIEFDEDSVTIITDDWYYTFNIIYESSGKIKLTFADDAKFATYLTKVDYNLEWQEQTKNWFIISRVVTFLNGSFEDKAIVGKLIKYKNPIPLLYIY